MINDEEIVKKLLFFLSKSFHAFKNYSSNGEIYVFAKIIFDSNQKAKEVINEYGGLVDASLQDAFIQISIHIEAWSLNWLEHKKELGEISIFDRFYFDTKFPFPKQSEKELKQFLKLKS